MRTGADYRESLRDGRKVWVMGEGAIEPAFLRSKFASGCPRFFAVYPARRC